MRWKSTLLPKTQALRRNQFCPAPVLAGEMSLNLQESEQHPLPVLETGLISSASPPTLPPGSFHSCPLPLTSRPLRLLFTLSCTFLHTHTPCSCLPWQPPSWLSLCFSGSQRPLTSLQHPAVILLQTNWLPRARPSLPGSVPDPY